MSLKFKDIHLIQNIVLNSRHVQLGGGGGVCTCMGGWKYIKYENHWTDLYMDINYQQLNGKLYVQKLLIASMTYQ